MKVMCDAYTPAGNPIPTNKRHNAAKIFSSSKVASEEPWYYLLPQLYINLSSDQSFIPILFVCDSIGMGLSKNTH